MQESFKLKHFLHLCFVFAVVKAITVPSFGRKNARQVAEHAEAWRGTDERREDGRDWGRLGVWDLSFWSKAKPPR